MIKLFEFQGYSEVVAAETITEAADFFFDEIVDPEEGVDLRLKEITGSELDTRKVYDEDGVVSGYSGLVSFRAMMEADEEDWDGRPYIFSSME